MHKTNYSQNSEKDLDKQTRLKELEQLLGYTIQQKSQKTNYV